MGSASISQLALPVQKEVRFPTWNHFLLIAHQRIAFLQWRHLSLKSSVNLSVISICAKDAVTLRIVFSGFAFFEGTLLQISKQTDLRSIAEFQPWSQISSSEWTKGWTQARPHIEINSMQSGYPEAKGLFGRATGVEKRTERPRFGSY